MSSAALDALIIQSSRLVTVGERAWYMSACMEPASPNLWTADLGLP